jgi:hypothetical protein
LTPVNQSRAQKAKKRAKGFMALLQKKSEKESFRAKLV